MPSASEITQFLGEWRLEAPSEVLSSEMVESVNADLQRFAGEQALRFARTASLFPAARAGDAMLEIGSAPYLMSLIFAHRLGYRVLHTNLTHDSRLNPPITMRNRRSGESVAITWDELNVETDRFPYDDASLAVVACCEVIEHLTVNPVPMLGEIHRVLQPAGSLILTTPNALRAAHLRDLSRGLNIHDRYRHDYVYGAYSRHNREYTPWELHELLESLGFSVRHCTTEDIYPSPRGLAVRLEDFWLSIPQRVRALVSRRMDARMAVKRDLIFVVATKSREFTPNYPQSIFYPKEV